MIKIQMLVLKSLALLACLQPANAQSMNKYALDSQAPAAEIATISGEKISLSSCFETNRIILLFVPPSYENEAGGYLKHLSENEAKLNERDLKIFVIAAPESALQKSSFGALIKVAGSCDPMPTSMSPNFDNGPLFILIGKDRNIKLREPKFVSDKAFFGVIDAMPMRRAEMKSKSTR